MVDPGGADRRRIRLHEGTVEATDVASHARPLFRRDSGHGPEWH